MYGEESGHVAAWGPCNDMKKQVSNHIVRPIAAWRCRLRLRLLPLLSLSLFHFLSFVTPFVSGEFSGSRIYRFFVGGNSSSMV